MALYPVPVSSSHYVIQGGRPLEGEVAVSGSKNAALYTLPAALLTSEPVTLRNVPRIADIRELAEICEAVGSTVEIEGDTVRMHTPRITSTVPPADLIARLRASFLLMGALIGRVGEAECPPPGGDVIGSRPLDVHFAGFRALGATVDRHGASWRATAPRLTGARIFFDYPSVLGTVNVLFAAVRAEGTTVIVNAAPEPEVEMLADMLVSMGASITGQGSPVITVQGGVDLHGTDFTVIPDRLEVGTYLLAGVATRGDVRVTNAQPAHLDSLLAKLREMDVQVDVDEAGVRVHDAEILRPVQVQAVPYPGFATDLHPPMAAALTQAAGVSMVHERVYDNRTLYVNELRKLGARITTAADIVLIEGPTKLSGANVRALDIRAGAAVVVAALAAEGETVLGDIHHLDRGYADLQERLTALGARIERR